MPALAPPGALPCVTIDCVIFGFQDFRLKILLVRRDIDPQRGQWQIPGGWVGEAESLDEAAQRILEEATGVSKVYMEQLGAFGEVGRFPDKRIITIGYSALINPIIYNLRHGPEVSDVRWFDAKKIPRLTFDHNDIVQAAFDHLKVRVRHEPISFELLPDKFTLPQIQTLYESILGEEMDRRNFRKKLLRMNILEKLDETQQRGPHRAAQLYRFDRENYEKLTRTGLVKYAF
ncbi:MAG: NUDIX domain-containing protein [Bacteroidia bacterium]